MGEEQEDQSGQELGEKEVDPPSHVSREPENGQESRLQAQIHSGPLPPPEQLAKYDNVVEKGAERIFQMAEAEASHVKEMEKRKLRAERIGVHLGQLLAFILGLEALIAATVMAIYGYPWPAGIIGAGVPGGLAATFLTSSSRRQRTPEEATASKERPKKEESGS